MNSGANASEVVDLDELDEYGIPLRTRLNVAAQPRPNAFQRFMLKPLRARKPGQEEHFGWTWGKLLFVGGIIGLIVGVSGLFAYKMARGI